MSVKDQPVTVIGETDNNISL